MGADAYQRRGPGAELLVEAHGPVRLVTLNRPDALNATNEALHGELARIWPELDADPEVGAIALTGAGKASLELAARLAAYPSQAVRETKALLNRALRGAVASMLHDAMTAESASFDEAAFKANLAKMLRRSASS